MINVPHEHLELEAVVPQDGYMFIYLVNESLDDTDVYFDDFTISHIGVDILKTTDFYPFGLALKNWQKEDYRFGYQGQFAEMDEETGWNSFELRMYDPIVARWVSTDPYGQFASPYLGMGNNPVSFVDPDGGLCCNGIPSAIHELSEQFAITATRITTSAISTTAAIAATTAAAMARGSGGFIIEHQLNVPMGDLGANTYTHNSLNPQGQHTPIGPEVQSKGLESIDFGVDFSQPPGFAESLIPVWGSGREAVASFSAGNYWKGAAYSLLAISDIFLVKSIATGIARGAWKLGSHTWTATRAWYGKRYGLPSGTHVHHWLISQKTIEKYGWQALANQPWNLKPMLNPRLPSGTLHRAVHGWGRNAFNSLERAWYGTPIWFKAGTVSGAGRVPGAINTID